MRALLLGARGAVGSVVARELKGRGVLVTAGGRSAEAEAHVDLAGDLATLSQLSARHDVVINASGIERPEIAAAVGETPLVEISASGGYLAALRVQARGPVVLGAGLAPGLSTALINSLNTRDGDEVDLLVMLGAGEAHGAAAVEWTAGLVGADIYQPPEGGVVRNLRQALRAAGPDRRVRRYLRADFPDHLLVAKPLMIRSYLTLSSAPMTAALQLVGRVPRLRWALGRTPHIGSSRWHLVAHNRRSGERLHAEGDGQSEATGKLTALAAVRVVEQGAEQPAVGVVTMAELMSLDEALSVLR